MIQPSQSNATKNKRPKRSPLAGWFGRKNGDEPEPLPEMNTGAGVSRVLRLSSSANNLRDAAAARGPIQEALTAIEVALYAIDEIRDIIEQAYEVAISAHDTSDEAGRALLAESYDELRLAITEIADSADGQSSTLVGKQRRQIDVRLGGQAHYSVSPIRLDPSDKGLALSPPRDAFSSDDEVFSVIEELDRALQKADRAAASYCRDAKFLIARLEVARQPHAAAQH